MKEVKINDLRSFSINIGALTEIEPDILFNHIISAVASALADECKYKQEILEIYGDSKHKLDDIDTKKTYSLHVFDQCSYTESDSIKKKAKLLLILAESDSVTRLKLIELLKNGYKNIYRSVRKYESRFINYQYTDKNNFFLKDKAIYERSVYIYFCIYCSPSYFDSEFLVMIMNNIINFENDSLLKLNTEDSYEALDDHIKREKQKFDEAIGSIDSYDSLFDSEDSDINFLCKHLKTLFSLNKLNPYEIFGNYQYENIKTILLSHIKSKFKVTQNKSTKYLLISEIFIQSLIYRFNQDKQFYSENSSENLELETYKYRNLLLASEDENEIFKNEIDKLKAEIKSLNDAHYIISNKNISTSYKEISSLKKQITMLQSELYEEKKFRSELYSLREIIFNSNPEVEGKISEINPENFDALKQINILIIGGAKNWRQKLKGKYPNISTINGHNINFQLCLFNNFDCVLFFTNYMSHAVYNKAMNYVRSKKLKFGYIKTVNIDLLENEIYHELKKCNLI